MITAQTADGTLHQFPDGTPDSVIDGAMKQYAASQHAPGGIESVIRGAANGATFNLMPMIAAAGDAVIPLDAGSSKAPTFSQRYEQNLANQRDQDRAAIAGHPGAMMAGNLAGGLLNPVTRALPVAKTALGAIGQGMSIGAGYGTGTALSNQDSLPQAAKDIGEGAALGGAVPGVIAGAAPAARAVGGITADALGLTTGAGGNAVRGAFNAGRAGGDASDAFASAMRGQSNPMDAVAQAKDALGQMRIAKNAQYRSGMLDISADKSVLDFKPVQDAFDDASTIQTFKGQKLGGAADDTQERLAGIIDNWKQLDPSEYHTPEGMDFLKQQVGEVLADTKPNTAASTMAGKVYNAIKTSIKNQAPTYAKVMSDYSDAADQINNIQRELSLGKNANPATALRKLQSVMRDNVNTSYGQRADYVDQLDKGATMVPALAGQALKSVMPRGLSGGVATLEGMSALGGAIGGHPISLAALPALAAASPRLVGEAAYGLGAGARLGGKLLPTINGRALTAPSVSALVPAMLPRLKN